MRELIFQRKAVRKLVEYTWCLEQRVITLLNLPPRVFCNTLILRAENQIYHKSWDEPMIHSLVALIYNKV